jgi:hypothetical protein
VRDRILPEFQDFLLSRSIVDAKNVPFYAHWASKFLAFSNKNQDLTPDLRVQKFLNHLKSQKNIADWQSRQAEKALRLYIHHFLDGKISALSPNSVSSRTDLPQKIDPMKIVADMRQAIRIKHYSYSTERSYIEWVERFIDYTSTIKRKDLRAAGLDSGDVKDFLSYLALKRRVSSSTQN